MDGRDGAPRQYRGMLDCFRQVARKEGLAGLYKARALCPGPPSPPPGLAPRRRPGVLGNAHAAPSRAPPAAPGLPRSRAAPDERAPARRAWP